MKYSLRSSFSRYTLGLFVSVLFVTVLGLVVARTGSVANCTGLFACAPGTSIGYLKLAHFAFVGIASVMMALVWRKAWREQREHQSLLPLTTVTGVMFFGQALIGAIQVSRGYPQHLVILHSLTAISLWVSLLMLVLIAATLTKETIEAPRFDWRQRAKDFYILSKPLIVALLLLTT